MPVLVSLRGFLLSKPIIAVPNVVHQWGARLGREREVARGPMHHGVTGSVAVEHPPPPPQPAGVG